MKSSVFRRRYGDSPPHLLLLLGSFALTAYAGVRLLRGDWLGIVLWFVGAAVLHDLVLLPLYGLADRALRRAVPAPASYVTFVRVPAFVSGLLLLVWFPLIAGTQRSRYERAAGLSADVFLPRWLLITAGLFAVSALWLSVRAAVWRARARRRDAGS
ncbi:hypothetical protein [Streptomyces botrytidirepellens]|uniref:Uncharacterized protein n=1 Tax=Streptomyces botrytidirepellens TaxID=2486417 RepID=A0A3M8VYT5_9ACTN|nr:hypothetical protein [Streptomyces botrytidirepellens]RNG21689.1 hypothetical protein EEJ42_22065 [Streptomyces botrytidirepellens]